MTRRTLLHLPALGAFATAARSQYVLAPQSPPREQYPPSSEQVAEIRRKMAQLAERLSASRENKVADETLVEVEIFHKAAEWIGRHNEYYYKDSVAKTLALLDAGLARAGELEAGKPTWPTATGLVIRAYRSQVDGSAQPYLAHVPASYNGSQPGRLDVLLHGTNRGMGEVEFLSRKPPEIRQGGIPLAPIDFIQIECLGRTNNAYRWAGEADVLEAVEAAKRSYAIDENRILLRGFSMGGAGAWHLGLHYPDRWAAIEAGAGFTETIEYARMKNLPDYQLKALHIYDSQDYALNVFQLPTVGYGGEEDRQLAASVNIRKQLGKEGFSFEPDGLNWKTKELPVVFLVGPKTPHRWEPESKKRSEAFLSGTLKKGRAEPDHIRFVTYTTRYDRCFWVRVGELDQHYERAEVDAKRSQDGTNVEVKTKNVAVLLLNIPHARTLAIDGQQMKELSTNPELVFLKRQGAWREYGWEAIEGTLRKQHGLQGPIDDAFLDSFLCVRPTGRAANDIVGRYAEETLSRFTDDFAKYFRGQVRVSDDTLNARDAAEHNLILFGDPKSNRVIEFVLRKLPLQWDERKLTMAGRHFDAANHTIAMIYPNPMAPGRYVVLNTGHSFHENEMAATNAALFPRFGDYAVLQLRQPVGKTVESEIVTAGYFDEKWQVPGPQPERGRL
jgi:pimeloyl-ACP methyl ester carboxylesterase